MIEVKTQRWTTGSDPNEFERHVKTSAVIVNVVHHFVEEGYGGCTYLDMFNVVHSDKRHIAFCQCSNAVVTYRGVKCGRNRRRCNHRLQEDLVHLQGFHPHFTPFVYRGDAYPVRALVPYDLGLVQAPIFTLRMLRLPTRPILQSSLCKLVSYNSATMRLELHKAESSLSLRI